MIVKKIFPKSRKGQLFTIMAILLIVLMFVSFEVFSVIHERQAIKKRVATMNSFLNSIEKNLERQLYISGFRIIFLAEAEITSTGSYITNLDSFFEEGFYNGTVNGINKSIMSGATYNDMLLSLNDKGERINVDISMNNTIINVSQDNPWNVKITMVSNFSMVDKGGLVRWDKQQHISTLIPVEGFEDPFFTIGSGGRYSRKINRTIYDGYYVDCGSPPSPPCNFANLSEHVEAGYYTNNTDAPSFLNRLTGNFSADVNGIESFVRPSDVGEFNIYKTCIDHLYFSTDTSGDQVSPSMPSWFKIDDGHRARYGVIF